MMRLGSDPPDSLKRTWKLIANTLILNTIIVPLLLLTAATVFDVVRLDLDMYQRLHTDFTRPFSDIFFFIKTAALDVALHEEFHYRIFTWLLVLLFSTQIPDKIYKGLINQKNSKYNLLWFTKWFLIICTVTISNFLWTKLHYPSFNYAMVTIFIAGLSWNWLIIRTGKMWPAVVSHIVANTTIFIFLKIAIYFSIITLSPQ